MASATNGININAGSTDTVILRNLSIDGAGTTIGLNGINFLAGGAVTVEVSCDQRVKRVRIGKEAVDPEDLETLEDLVTVAVNDALGKASEASQNRMASVTGGMRIPGLM